MTDLFAAADLEKMLRGTGGVSVSVQGTSTWGHEEVVAALAGADFESRPGGTDDVVVIPTDVPPNPVQAGEAITVDGETLKVVDHDRIEDGRIIALVVGSWTHTVDTYRPSTASEIPRVSGQQQLQFDSTHLSGVSCDLMALSGEIRAERSGDRASVEYEGRFPPGTDIQPGDYVKVTAGEGPKRYRVVFVGDRTSRWPTRVELEESDEDF